MDDPDLSTPARDRGILTTDDRDYFLGRKNLTEESEGNTRQRIRDRTRNGLYDFEYLARSLGENDLSIITTESGDPDDVVFEAAEYVIAFLYRMCASAPDSPGYSTNDRFRDILHAGIEKGIDERHEVLNFKLELQTGNPREARARILERISNGESLTLAELREALNNEYLDDSFLFRPLDEDGFPKNVDPEDTFSHDDYSRS